MTLAVHAEGVAEVGVPLLLRLTVEEVADIVLFRLAENDELVWLLVWLLL